MFNISLLAWPIRLSFLVLLFVAQLLYTEPLQLSLSSNTILLRTASSRLQEGPPIGINASPSSNVVIDALTRFKELHGSLRIPASFKVPNNSLLWPEHTWGMHLGRRVADMRAGKIWQDPTRLDHLNSLGFIWKPSVNTLAQTIQGIEVYSRLYPGQPLSSSFRVPNTMQENMWPESLLGFPLGSRVRRFREKMNSGHDVDIELKRALDKLPVGHIQISEEDLLLSVQGFKAKYGHVQIPRTYVVSDSSNWPEHLRGISLGSRIMDIRRKKSGTDALRAKLGELGVNIAVGSSTIDYERIDRFDDILVALKLYLSIHGNLNVPRGFIVPENVGGTQWESCPHIWGLELGENVRYIRKRSRERKLSPDARQALNAIGFIWKIEDYRFYLFLEALECYKRIYRDIDVPALFCVPRNNRNTTSHFWRTEHKGFRLGYTVQSYRTKCISSKHRTLIMKRFPTFFNTTKVSPSNHEKRLFNATDDLSVFLHALSEYQLLLNCSNVPENYVASVNSYRKEAYPLGKILARVKKEGVEFLLTSVHARNRSNNRRSMHSLLHKFNISIPSVQDVKFERICRALLCHQNLYGDMLVPRYFIVPKDDSAWPDDCRGMKLGLRVRDLKYKLSYNEPRYHAVLQAIGFDVI